MAPHNASRSVKQKPGRSLQKKPSGLKKAQPIKREDRPPPDHVIDENVNKEAEEEDNAEEERRRNEEEERRRWLEEQRVKYPIAPDGYIPNSVILRRLGVSRRRNGNENGNANEESLSKQGPSTEFLEDFDWSDPFSNAIVSGLPVDQSKRRSNGNDAGLGLEKAEEKWPPPGERIDNSGKCRRVNEDREDDDDVFDEVSLDRIGRGSTYNDIHDDVDTNRFEPEELVSMETTTADNASEIETTTGLGGISDGNRRRRRHKDSRRISFLGDRNWDDDDDDNDGGHDGYDYDYDDVDDDDDDEHEGKGEFRRKSVRLGKLSEEQEDGDEDLRMTGTPERCVENEDDRSSVGKFQSKNKPGLGELDVDGISVREVTRKPADVAEQGQPIGRAKTGRRRAEAQRKRRSAPDSEVNFRIKLCQDETQLETHSASSLNREAEKVVEASRGAQDQVSQSETDTVLVIRKMKTRSDYENERRVEMYHVINGKQEGEGEDQSSDLQNDEKLNSTKVTTYVGVVRRNKNSSNDSVVHSPAPTKVKPSPDSGRPIGGRVSERSRARLRPMRKDCRGASADGVRVSSASAFLPGIEGTSKVQSAGSSKARHFWCTNNSQRGVPVLASSAESSSKPTSGSSLMSTTLIGQNSEDSNKMFDLSPTTYIGSYSTYGVLSLPKIGTFDSDQSGRRRKVKHHCLYSKLLRMHLHEHIQVGKHIRTMELYSNAANTAIPVSFHRYDDLIG